MSNIVKRLLAMLLACTLAFGMLPPVAARAEEPGAEPQDPIMEETPAENSEGCETLGHSWTDADCDSPRTCSACGITEGEALGHGWVAADCDSPRTCSVCGTTEGEALGHIWTEGDGVKVCYVCDAEEEISQPEEEEETTEEPSEEIDALSEEELTVSDYATFLAELKVLEGYADDFASTAGKTSGELVVNFIRTGVERYNDGNWKTLAGEEITSFVTYVQEQDAANNTTAMRLRNIVIENFRLPNGNQTDFGHMFGTMNISYVSSIQSADLAGWAGDLCDLLLYSKEYGNVPAGTVEEMAAYILEYCFGVDADDAFGWDDFYGDLDAYYLISEWKNGSDDLSAIMETYFTTGLDDGDRSAYFLNNRFSGLETQEDVRTAVFETYSGNIGLQVLEADRGLSDDDDMRQAACYAFADYLFQQGGDRLEGGSGETPDPDVPTGPEDPDTPTDPEDPEEDENPYYTDFSVTNSYLAPGITQSIHYAISADDKQMVYYVATVDVNREDVTIMANYRNADPSQGWGMARVTDQVDALMAKHTNPADTANYIENFNVVVATNGDGYNTSTGEPGGLLVMGGKTYHPIDSDGFFAILKDGSAIIGTREDYDTYKDQIQEAIGGFGATLVKDGKISINKSSEYYTSRASRTAIGLTADGKVVMMVLDGRQEPFSCGGSMEEIAQIMYEAGCVHAINLDGGGSTTYASKPEGADKLKLVNRPSDGFQRSVAATLAAVSTAKTSNAFDHATITFDYDYLTIGTSVTGTAVGVSDSGNAAPIPANAVWQVSDETIGTITQNGVFTAAADGEVEVRLMVEDEEIGSAVLHVVVPDELSFVKEEFKVVYGVPTEIGLNAFYGGSPVAYNSNDVWVVLASDDAGTLDGLVLTGSEESNIRTTMIGALLLADQSVMAIANINFYKDGEAVFEFDDVTGGSRQLAWKRVVSNANTHDGTNYSVDDPAKPMDVTYTFGLDMKSIEIPEQLSDLTYMLPGADTGATAWDFLLQLAERVSVLTEVKITAQFDPSLDVDISGLSVMNEYFRFESAQLNEETNELTVLCRWVDQTQAIDPATANPICILSGIKAAPRDGAAWDDAEQLKLVNSGEVSYRIYLRASSLYSFAKKPENQEKFGLVPYSSTEVQYNGGPEQGAWFGTTYARYEDHFSLNKGMRQGWYSFDDKLYYYVDHVPVTGIQKVPARDDASAKRFYEFDENGVCKGTVTGIFDYQGGKCYAIMGEQKYGWVATYDADGNAADYYFDPTTGKAVNGKCKVEGYNYEFTDYILTKGDLVTDANGTRYRWAGLWQHGKWFEHEGNTYHLPRYQYYVVTGYANVAMGDGTKNWCLFDENGVFQKDYSGKYDVGENTYLLKNGILQIEPGLVKLEDGYYYYFSANNAAIKNRTYWPTKTNGLLPIAPYVFDELGRITNAPGMEPEEPDVPDTPDEPDTPVVPEPPAEKKNGIHKLNGAWYYYKDDVIQYCAGLVQLEDGSYIYVRSNGQLAIGSYWITVHNNLLPVGFYHFGDDGKMTNAPGTEPEEPGVPDTPDEPEKPEVKNGIHEEGGILYYYKDGIRAYCAGLVKLEDGSYIYVRSNGQLAIGRYWITNDNGLLPQGQYNFGADGKMTDAPETEEPDTPDVPDTPVEPEKPEIRDGVYEVYGALYYYKNGDIQYGAGLVKLTDEAGVDYYIYVRSNGQLATGNYWPTTTNGLLPGNRMYTFDANGRYYK